MPLMPSTGLAHRMQMKAKQPLGEASRSVKVAVAFMYMYRRGRRAIETCTARVQLLYGTY